ncbi:MAG: SRPBCC domain-containing protein [Actinomycetota bacterium]
MAKTQIKAQAKLAIEPAEAFRMFTNSTAVREWLADAAIIAPKPGGRVFLGWNDGYQTAGNFNRWNPPTALGFSWRGPDEKQTIVKVGFEAAPDGGTLVRVRHTGFATGKRGRSTRRALQSAWERSLENLASVVGSGEDLRFTRRPMLGVFVDDVVRGDGGRSIGVRLGGVVEGMGAAGAGLRGGDVVTALGGTKIGSFSDLTAALTPHRAGDTVEVALLRDGQDQRVAMTLSGRPIGDLKTTASDLTAQVADMSRHFGDSLDEVLAGVTNEEAEFRPGAGEWSVKEVMAHLIDGEGDQHSYLAEAFEGGERYHDLVLGNSHWRTAVTAASYPDPATMLASYRRLMAQTVELLRAMPEDLEHRRGTFWRFAFGFADGESHHNQHVDQIRAALEAARRGSNPEQG